MRGFHRNQGPGFGFGPGRRNDSVDSTGPGSVEECTLDQLRSGDDIEILSVDDDYARMHALRFGMAEGAHARCVTRVPAGPIVMRSGRQEIAVGRKLAQRIRVRKTHSDARKAG